MVAIAANLNC